jgi:post-segregation antitoxin (ccd killing protein)
MHVEDLGKVRVNLTIDEEVKKKAEELGLNLSKVAENALKEAVRKLEAKDPPNDPVSSANASSQEGLNGASGGIRTRDQQLTRLPLRPS